MLFLFSCVCVSPKATGQAEGGVDQEEQAHVFQGDTTKKHRHTNAYMFVSISLLMGMSDITTLTLRLLVNAQP